MAVGQPGEGIGDRPGVKLAFKAAQMLDRAHQAQRPLGRAVLPGKGLEAERIPALAARIVARPVALAGGHRKLDPAAQRPPGERSADMLGHKAGMVARGQIGDMRQQQRRLHIKAELGNIGRGVDDETAMIEPDDDIARRFLDQAAQQAAIHVIQPHFHVKNCPSDAQATLPIRPQPGLQVK